MCVYAKRECATRGKRRNDTEARAEDEEEEAEGKSSANIIQSRSLIAD